MALRKSLLKKPMEGQKTTDPIDPLLKENVLWANEMQSVLSPYWASRAVYPGIARRDTAAAEEKRAA